MGIFANYAIRYARQGYPVFPLAPGSKKPPKGSHGLSEATTDERQIAEWSRQLPDGNIGVLTGRESFNVADIDPLKGGFDTERALRSEGKTWPETPVQRTRSGGRHIILQHHELIVTGTDRLGPGIDFRGAGGYIVVAPSIFEGRKYQWLHWPKTGIAPAPDWLIEHIKADAARREAEAQERAKNTVKVDPKTVSERDRSRYEGSAKSVLRRAVTKISQQPEPGRGTALYNHAGFLAPYIHAGFIDEGDVRGELEGACRTNGLTKKDGLEEIRRTITRAFACSNSQLPDLDKLGDRPYRRVA